MGEHKRNPVALANRPLQVKNNWQIEDPDWKKAYRFLFNLYWQSKAGRTEPSPIKWADRPAPYVGPMSTGRPVDIELD